MIITISTSGDMEEVDWDSRKAFKNAKEFINGPIEFLTLDSDNLKRVVKKFYDKEVTGNVVMAIHEEGKIMAFSKNKPASKFFQDTLEKKIGVRIPEKELILSSEIKGPVVIFTGEDCAL